jgi:hypothetical protein
LISCQEIYEYASPLCSALVDKAYDYKKPRFLILVRRVAIVQLIARTRNMAFLLTLATLGGFAQGAVLPRASIDSDAVVGFAQTVPSGTTGEVYLAYQPYLKVVNGCVPFPAVDAEGNTK